MPAPLRQALWRLARQAAQGVAGRGDTKAALDKRLCPSCGETGFVGLVREEGLLVPASFLLQPNGFVVLALIDALNRLSAAEMQVEQAVKCRATFGRRCQRCKRGLPDVLEAARAEQ